MYLLALLTFKDNLFDFFIFPFLVLVLHWAELVLDVQHVLLAFVIVLLFGSSDMEKVLSFIS